jgi:hypothetical protein
VRSLALASLLLLSSAGCEVRFDAAHRSGTVSDDYVGEPLTKDVKKYEHALEVCNEFVRRLKKGEYDSIHAELCAESFQKAVGEHGIETIDRDAVACAGAMKSYKPLQWGFATRVELDRKFLYSVKIVEYERRKIRFTFVFDDDGKYDKLVGVHMRAWDGPRAPGQF